MDSGSDTEPESQGSVPGWDAAHYVRATSTHASRDGGDGGAEWSLPAKVEDAVRSLQAVDLDRVEDDIVVQETIQDASTTIMQFLNGVSSWPEPRTDEESELEADYTATFLDVVHPRFLELLFEHREVFHQIAAKDVGGGGAAPTVVCWVDAVLVRMSDAILAFVGRGCEAPESPGASLSTLAQQRESDALYAATQLPASWKAVPKVLAADYASPAAKRLALHLLFGAHVLARTRGDNSAVCEDAELVGTLETVLHHIVSRATVSSCRLGGQPMADLGSFEGGVSERIRHAMILALHAEVDLATTDKSRAQFRPHTQATLLHYMSMVVSSEDAPCDQRDLFAVSETLDGPLSILLRWSRVIPWSWSLCEDRRILNSEIIDAATAYWLFHNFVSADFLGDPDAGDSGGVLEDIDVDMKGAAMVIVRILHDAASSLLSVPPAQLIGPALRVLQSGCWAMCRILESGGLQEDLSPFFDTICRLFLLMRRGEEENSIRDLILQSLTYATKGQLVAVVNRLADDPTMRFGIRLDEELSRLTSLVKSIGLPEPRRTEDVLAVRCMLNFMTVLGHAGARGFCREELFLNLVDALVTLGESLETAACPPTLLDCLLAAYATAGRPAVDASSKNDESGIETVDAIWQMALETEPDDLLTASAFAAFASTTASQMSGDPLTMAEAWDYLRDAVLLILSHHFLGEEEPLALLVCPGILSALCCLFRCADSGTKQYILSSPWTINLCADLKQLPQDGGGDAYARVLKERSQPFVDALLRHIAAELELGDGTKDTEALESVTRLIFCRMHSMPRIILACTDFEAL